MNIIGLDIGGANLKAAHGDGEACSAAFPLWRSPELLADRLAEIIGRLPRGDEFAVTMTGELCDCFRTKAEGVDSILTAVERVAEGKPIRVWQTVGEFVTPDIAREFPVLTAAANWHALACWAGRAVSDRTALLIDIGTTTTDIIPLDRGLPIAAGLTDRERLVSGELVYSGVERTPVAAVVQEVPFRDVRCPVAAEFFAGMKDVYLLLHRLPEDEADRETANGQPATIAAAHDRLARMICCDVEECSQDDALQIARYVAGQQQLQLLRALRQVVSRLDSVCKTVVIAGAGSFLAEELVSACPLLPCDVERVLLSRLLGESASRAACAFAVARLAAEC